MTLTMDLKPGSERRRRYRPPTLEQQTAAARDAEREAPWRNEAACRDVTDPAIFFPHADDAAAIRAARTICAACPVRAECLEYAMATREPYGTFGGKTEWERRRMRRGWRIGQQRGEDWPLRLRLALDAAGLGLETAAARWKVAPTSVTRWTRGNEPIPQWTMDWVRQQETTGGIR